MTENNMKIDYSKVEEMRTRQSHFAVDINAPRQKVWTALTNEIGRWWPRDLVTGPAVKFSFDLRVGGRLWEDHGKGAGVEWGSIKALIPETRIVLTTDVFPDMGGPARSVMEYTLEDTETGTRVRWSENRFGCIDDSVMMGQWLPPWSYGLEGRLKPYVEGTEMKGGPAVEE